MSPALANGYFTTSTTREAPSLSTHGIVSGGQRPRSDTVTHSTGYFFFQWTAQLLATREPNFFQLGVSLFTEHLP